MNTFLDLANCYGIKAIKHLFVMVLLDFAVLMTLVSFDYFLLTMNIRLAF